jgi:sec-independent protein translocase protein TatA
MGDIGWVEILIIAVVILILFGSKKMPDAARSLGRSLRILKTEVKGMHDDDAPSQPSTTPAPPAELPAGSSAPTQAPSQQAQSPSTTGAGERTDLH